MKLANALVARIALALAGLGSLAAVVWLAVITTTPVPGSTAGALTLLSVCAIGSLLGLFALGVDDR